MFEARVINLCDIATNFGAVAGEVILVDSCACTVILVYVIVIYISEKNKKKRETEFLLAVLLFTCRSGTVKDKIVCGIRFQASVF